ncbi:MAG: hypothetical protein LC115_00570 [Bacteroidia bacterium]|nr:hypothetical protein [Bacteroidia bacterium]
MIKFEQFIGSDTFRLIEKLGFWLSLFGLLRLIVCLGFVFEDGRGIVVLDSFDFESAGTDGYIQLAKTWLETGKYAYFKDSFPVHTRPPVTAWIMKFVAAPYPTYWYWGWFSFTIALFTVASLLFFLTISVRISAVFVRRFILISYLLFPPLLASVRAATFLPIGVAVITCWAVAVYWMFQKKDIFWVLIVVVLAIIAALTHATLVLLFPVSLWGIWSLDSPLKKRIISLLIFCTVFFAGIFPWTLRNYQQFHQFIPIASGAGAQYWKGEESIFGTTDIIFTVYQKKYGKKLNITYFGTDTPQQDNELWKLATDDMLQNPAKLLERIVRGAFLFWFPNDSFPMKRTLLLLLNLPWIIWWLSRSIQILRKQFLQPLFLFCVFMWAAFAFFGAEASYYVMLLPLIWLQIGFSYEKKSLFSIKNFTTEAINPKIPK